MHSWLRLAIAIVIACPSILKADSCFDLFKTTQKGTNLVGLKGLPDRSLTPTEMSQLATQLGKQKRTEILEKIAVTAPAENGRTYVKVYEDQNLTAWAIRWDGAPTDIHDHVLSQAGIYVLKGEILEERYFPPNVNPVPKILSEGDSKEVAGLPYVHRISGSGSVSIHIYSPPLSEMNIYGLDSAGQLVSVKRWTDDEP